jgi:hypothetical protein
VRFLVINILKKIWTFYEKDMSESNYDRRHEAMAPPKRPYKNNRGKKFKKTKDNYFRGRNFNTPYHYFNAKYKFESRWACFRWRRPPLRNTPENEASRPASPFSGTEEYTLKKIQETSDMIKKRLMMPPDAEESVATAEPAPVGNEPAVTVSEVGDDGSGKSDCDRSTMRSGKKVAQYNVEEIHEKIIKHITNLSHGKKVNLICGTSSGYDVAIQQIQKQKRLELSKVLRDMCSNHAAEDGEDIDDIIPDIGIKIKDLPLEVIQQLSSTLDLNFDDTFFSQSSDTTVNVKSEVSDLIFDRPAPEEVTIKNEIVCDETDYAMDDLDFGFPQNGDCHEESGLQSENEAGGANRNLFDSVGACDLSYDRPTKDEITIKDEIVCDEADYAMDNLDFNLSKKIKCENLDESKPVVNTNCSESVANQSAPSEAISVSSQTSCVDTRCSSTQTDVALSNYIQLQDFDKVNSLEGAVDAMLKIDNEVMRLTELRRSIFIKLQTKKKKQNTDKSRSPKKSATSPKKSAASLKKSATSSKNRNANVESMIAEQDKTTEKSKSGETATRSEPSFRYERALEFGPISEKILVIKTIDNTMLAASESGNIFFINARDGAITATLHVSDCPITALSTWTTPKTKKLHLLVGSFETQMREYLYDNLTLLRMINLGEFVQCLEPAWSCVFIGTKNGSLMRYSLRVWKRRLASPLP